MAQQRAIVVSHPRSTFIVSPRDTLLLADSRRRFSYRRPFCTITQYHHNYFYSFPTSIITMKSTSFLALLVTSLVASVFGFVPKTFSARSKGSTLSMSASERTYIMVRRRTNYPGIYTQNKPAHSQYTYVAFHLSLTFLIITIIADQA